MSLGPKLGVLHCPNTECARLILKRMALAEGSTFVMRCPSCSRDIQVIVGFAKIEKKLLAHTSDYGIISTNTSDIR